MNSFFVTQDEKNIKEELYEDEFLDERFQDRELPEDFFKDYFSQNCKEDVDLIVPIERKKFNTTELSSVGSIENVETQPTFLFGSKYVKEAMYDIKPDYEPAVIVMQYFFDYMVNPNIMFPYVPVAQPSIPFSAQEKTISYVDVEILMDQVGALIYDPSYPYQDKRDNSYYIHPSNPENEIEQFELKMQEKKFVFSSRSYFKSWHVETYKVANYEFNPMHPLAAPYIRDYKDDGRVVTGHYKWGRRLKPFRFDRLDTRYRIHSEVWYTIFGSRHYYMAMFDIVSNFDILIYFPHLNDCMLKTPYNVYPERIIEGYSVFDYTKSPYSFMMRERDEYSMNKEQWIVPYYSNIPIQVRRRGEIYFDVTHLFDLRYNVMSKYELMVMHRGSGTVVCLIMKGEHHRRYKGNPSYFVQFSLRCNIFHVYTDIHYENCKTEVFLKCEGCYFLGVPRNETGSLIKDPSIVSFQEYVQQIKMLSEDAEVVVRSMPIMDDKDIFQEVVVRTAVDYTAGVCDQLDKEGKCTMAVGEDDEAKFDFSPGCIFDEDD